MASSLYSDSQHVSFESVLTMEDPGMISMFRALIASGLEGFLGCPAVIFESELVEFFNNGSVKDGLVVSTVNGVSIEISEQLLAATFEYPVDGLSELSEMPKDKIFDARSIVSFSGEPVSLSGGKNQMKIEFRLLCDIMAKAISVKARSFNAITVEKFSLITTIVCGVRMDWAKILLSILKKMVTPGSKQAKGFTVQISLLLENIPTLELGESSEFPDYKILTDKTVHHFVSLNDKAGAEEVFGASKPKAVSKKRRAADIGAAMVAVAQEAVPIQMIETFTVAPSAETNSNQPADETDGVKGVDADVDAPTAKIDEQVADPSAIDETSVRECFEPAVEVPTEEKRCRWAGILTIPFDIPLPSSSMEITKIQMGEKIKIPEVTERTWFLNSLPSIPDNHKGKAILVEKDPGYVQKGGASFVLGRNRVASGSSAVDRKLYILIKYREVLVWKFLESWRANFVPGQGSSAVDLKVIELLSDLHLFIFEELAKEARAHGLLWTKTCCSKIFEGSPGDRGAVIARTNTNTRSSCWIRTIIFVEGVWTVEPCADKWVKIHRQVTSNEVPRQHQYDDTLPSMSAFFQVLKKRWADVCFEVVDFCASRRLLPVGSVNLCRGLTLGGLVFQVASRQSPVFAFRVSQFCSVFIDFSLFNWLPSADITDFLSSIALSRTAFRGAQISQNSVSVVPRVQFSVDQRLFSSSSADSSSYLHFDTTDVDATVSYLPPVSLDFSVALADFHAILSEQINESQSGTSSRLHKIEQVLRDSLSDQAALFKNLSQEARQEGRSIDDVQTLRFNEFRKNILSQNSSLFVGLADVRKEVHEVNAKVDNMASRVNDVQKDVEATKEAISHKLFEFQSQAQENHNTLHAQLSELVDYIHRGSADKKGESGSRGLQQPSNVQIEDSAVRPPWFAQRVEIAQRNIVETVLDADRNAESLERQAAAERDRERRRREARMLKRRRRD
ncbi:delphilin-like [Dorcoceras hygrometricum]|uniref:Delphilin-like n=1 Tax=Dorcoceras hygrometricum TaxID=472368 RepID=A0A2Z7BJQ0_9LAMI|nr:delphilin-like [Dorcoceras hygrometricum]